MCDVLLYCSERTQNQEGLTDKNLDLVVNKDYLSRGKPFAFIKELREELDRS
jgi:hypothetical protein